MFAGQNDGRARIFSPRMDYDEWTPLGRGDPLKNNPTFDYVPPVLDRVQYWLDSHTTEPSSKRDILVLGVTAKKTSPKIPEQFLKFVDGPKFTRTNQDMSYRNDFTGSTGAEPPKLVRTTSFRNGLIDYRNPNRIQSLPMNYYTSSYYNQKIKPYTMMMPPPMIQKPITETSNNFNIGSSKEKIVGYAEPSQPFSTQTEEGPILQDTHYYPSSSKDHGHYSSIPSRPYSTSKISLNKASAVSQIETIKSIYTPTVSHNTKLKYDMTTAPSVSFEKSNLIYQSTQTLSGGWLGNNGPISSSTGFPEFNQVTWETPDYSKDQYGIDHHAVESSNHEIVVGQNANIIVDSNSNENGEVVVGQKELSTDATSSSSESVTQTSTVSTIMNSTDLEDDTDTQPSQKMHIVVANSPSTIMTLETHKAKKGPVAVVMPMNYMEKNLSASSSDTSTMVHNTWDNGITSEMTKPTQQVPKSQSQPMRNTVTSMPILMEDRPSISSMPNRMMPVSQLSHQFSHPPSVPMMPSRHVNSSPYMFVPSQSVSQPIRLQSRPNHAMMHFIGSMRPDFRPSSQMSISHMSPSMTHMNSGAPVKNTIGFLPSKDQIHQRPSQPFPVTFTSPSSQPTLSMQTTKIIDEQPIDHHSSRLPATTTDSMTMSSSFVPTVSSTMEYMPTMDTEYQENTKSSQSPLMELLNVDESPKVKATFAQQLSSTNSPPRTTTVPSLTTDPIFSHYKQPAKPIRGPMYLIIQGHSKVKTYKPTVIKHGVPMENNEIVESVTERQLSKLEQLIKENTKNGIIDPAVEKRKLEEKALAEKLVSLRQESLMSLIENGLNGFTVSPSESDGTEDERRSANSVTSIEIN